jgi:hypothetical protein
MHEVASNPITWKASHRPDQLAEILRVAMDFSSSTNASLDLAAGMQFVAMTGDARIYEPCMRIERVR